jgi:predicted CXXCH cytochrome family protein
MLAVAVLWIVLGAVSPAGTGVSGCERCHLVLHTVPSGSHVAEWAASAHALRRVGCVRCHDGDADAQTAVEAHRSVLPATARASRVHRTQLPATCGACHPRQATGFTYSRHGAVLDSNDDRAPSCTSCHGAMSATVPSPTRLEQLCVGCHADPQRDAYPSDARALTEWLTDARARLHEAEFGIARIADDTARRQLWWRYDRAVDRANQAVGSLHAFDLSAARTSLALVRAELVAIERRLGTGTTQ